MVLDRAATRGGIRVPRNREAAVEPSELRLHAIELRPGEQIWASLVASGRGLRLLGVALLVYLYAQYALTQFPATRVAGERLASYLLDPLSQMGRAFVAELPSLSVLAGAVFRGPCDPEDAEPVFLRGRQRRHPGGELRAPVGGTDLPAGPTRHHRVCTGRRLPVHPGLGDRSIQGPVDLRGRIDLDRLVVVHLQLHGGIHADLSPAFRGGRSREDRGRVRRGARCSRAGDAAADLQERGSDPPEFHDPAERRHQLQHAGGEPRPDPAHVRGDRLRGSLAPGRGACCWPPRSAPAAC